MYLKNQIKAEGFCLIEKNYIENSNHCESNVRYEDEEQLLINSGNTNPIDTFTNVKDDVLNISCSITSSQNLKKRRGRPLEKKPSVRNWGCSFCPKIFTTYDNVLEHEHTHLQIKPYGCSFCDMKTTRAYNVSRHEERKHILKKAFAKHSLLHFRNKPFFCDHCSITYSQKSYLGKQERIDCNVLLYSCTYCGKTYIRKRNSIKKVDLNIRAYCCANCVKAMGIDTDIKDNAI